MEKAQRIPMSGSPQKRYGHSDMPRAIVSFPIEPGADAEYENMHALHESGDFYVLDNSPFYVFDISCGDTFSIEEGGGRILFKSVSKRGGHSTYRVKMPIGVGHDKFELSWSEIGALGCSYEGSDANARRIYSIDIPPGVSVHAVYELLEKNEQAGIWEFEEVHYFEPVTH